MRYCFLILVLIVFNQITFAQNVPPTEYSVLIKLTDPLYKTKNFQNSAHTYSSAFRTLEWKDTSTYHYNVACSWALGNVADSAFANLELVASKGNYSNYNYLLKVTDLLLLHDDKRWQPL